MNSTKWTERIKRNPHTGNEEGEHIKIDHNSTPTEDQKVGKLGVARQLPTTPLFFSEKPLAGFSARATAA
ncbi:MAG: hypothetical protein PHT19_01515 [Methylococcus sp.]|nr:hypothetical protein [Methylococcus sp.]